MARCRVEAATVAAMADRAAEMAATAVEAAASETTVAKQAAAAEEEEDSRTAWRRRECGTVCMTMHGGDGGGC